MLELLLNNSVTLVFLGLITYIGLNEYRKHLSKNQITNKQALKYAREQFNIMGKDIVSKLFASLAVAVIVSVFSFRELFLMDVFHTVFIASLLLDPAAKYIRRLFQ